MTLRMISPNASADNGKVVAAQTQHRDANDSTRNRRAYRVPSTWRTQAHRHFPKVFGSQRTLRRLWRSATLTASRVTQPTVRRKMPDVRFSETAMTM